MITIPLIRGSIPLIMFDINMCVGVLVSTYVQGCATGTMVLNVAPHLRIKAHIYSANVTARSCKLTVG